MPRMCDIEECMSPPVRAERIDNRGEKITIWIPLEEPRLIKGVDGDPIEVDYCVHHWKMLKKHFDVIKECATKETQN